MEVHSKSQPCPDELGALNDLVMGEEFLEDAFENGASRL
jgi:hypothetical protein